MLPQLLGLLNNPQEDEATLEEDNFCAQTCLRTSRICALCASDTNVLPSSLEKYNITKQSNSGKLLALLTRTGLLGQ